MKELTERLKAYARETGADLCGIAAAEDFDGCFTAPHRPADLLPQAKSVVVAAAHIPDGSLEAQRAGITNYSYGIFGYSCLNRELDAVALRITRFLETEGYRALPIPARGAHYWESKRFHGPLSFRHAAVAAGLGVFGWSGIVLTPQFGARQRFTAVLTDAPLPKDAPLSEKLCLRCHECVRNCPAGAISMKPWTCVLGGRTHTYGIVDGDRCAWVARGMTTRAWPGAPFNPRVDVEAPAVIDASEKFDAMWRKRDARLRCNEHDDGNYGATLCGRCMIFCRAGIRAMEARLARRRA